MAASIKLKTNGFTRDKIESSPVKLKLLDKADSGQLRSPMQCYCVIQGLILFINIIFQFF